MNVLVVGATGFIGMRLVHALAQAGHRVACGSRHQPLLTTRCARHVPLDYSRPPSAETLREALADIDVVINAVGILRESTSQSFTALHDTGPRVLFAACADTHVKRVIQISALGAEAGAVSNYHRSKHAADRALQAYPFDWAIVQPSLVYGAGGSSARLFDLLAALPLTPLPGGGRQRVQPVLVDDLVGAIVWLVQCPTELRVVVPAVGPKALEMREFLAQLRGALGLAPTFAIAIPKTLMRLAARIGDHAPRLLLDRETLGMLERGNVSTPEPLTKILGLPPAPVEEFIPPADREARRITAVMSWLLPALRVSLSLMWFIAAFVSMGLYPVEKSHALLLAVGVPAALAPATLWLAIGLDFSLGLATLLAHRLRWVWTAQIAVVLGYTAIITWRLPELWLEPFGPVAKNIPILALLLLMHQLATRK